MTTAILGAGGVGGLLGGLLARAGERVVFVARPATVAHLIAKGITVRSQRLGDFTVDVDAATQLGDEVDAVLVTVKAPDLAAALEAIPPSAVGEALLVPFLNGIDHVAAMRGRYPTAAVTPATIRVEAKRVATGEVALISPFAAIQLAATAATAHRVERLAASLRNAGLDVEVRTDEVEMLWDKLAFLAPMALVTTYAKGAMGTVRADHRVELVGCAREVAQVANAEGAAIDADRVVAALDGVPATMESSMQRDAAAGRPLEIDAIGGAVLRAAARHRLAVPVTSRIITALRDEGRAAS